MTNKIKKVMKSVLTIMLGHPDVKIWVFNDVDSLYVIQWDGNDQIHYDFYDWTDNVTTHTQLDNLEQMCWLIANKNARTDDARTDARTDDARTDARTDDARTDDARTDDTRTDDARTDDTRTDDARTDDARTDDARTDARRETDDEDINYLTERNNESKGL